MLQNDEVADGALTGMLFRQLVDPESSSFTYLIAARAGGEALFIDPVLEQVELYLRLIEALDLRLVFVVDTHEHDGASGLCELGARTGCVTLMGEQSRVDCVSRRLQDGERIDLDGVELRAIYTPGHTIDSYSFVGDDRVFTGDTLLIGGTGRTDLPTGDARAQYQSLFGRLLKLPGRLLVYPGHDYHGRCVSTIDEEKAHNPRLRVSSAEEYEALMERLRVPDPRMMDIPGREQRQRSSWSTLAALRSS
jgi:glyoxylase-like metal-dependent hydrolase (beta-lactamase superfamily II)